MVLTFIQGHSWWESKIFWAHFLIDFVMDLYEVQYAAITSWFV